MSLVASRRSVLTSAVLGLAGAAKSGVQQRYVLGFGQESFPVHRIACADECGESLSFDPAVSERVAELTRDIDVDCSFHNREKFTKLQEESRGASRRTTGRIGRRDCAGTQYQRGEQHRQ